jgi:hypothetical protein
MNGKNVTPVGYEKVTTLLRQEREDLSITKMYLSFLTFLGKTYEVRGERLEAKGRRRKVKAQNPNVKLSSNAQ